MKKCTDIDIDVKNRDDIMQHFDCVPGCERILDDGTIVPHKSGVHFDDVPVDPVTGCASIPYKTAEDMGYQKVDFLNVSAYEHVRDRQHLKELLSRDTPWDAFDVPEIVSELFQLKNQFSVVSIWKPTSIEQLAMLIAMIRPAKRHLQASNTWEEVEGEIWDYSKNKPGQMSFKRAHAVAYAHLIVAQLNALVEHISKSQ
ncbi:hypothetical protein NVP2275O_014 [Vibrio phage 2.275.O._10N.286.54.E11]|nr:hypothetical protein NVP2275O_014 [Vibrio phage 2.275.O._10N.286.54.E11]